MALPIDLNPHWLASSAGYQIERSLRFNSADSAYLNRTPASAGNRRTFTWSGWVKRSALGESNLFSADTASGNTGYTAFVFNSTNNLQLQVREAGANRFVITSSVYRDVSSWYHVVIAMDTTQATAANRRKMYVNGVEITAFGTSNDITQNFDTSVNNTVAQQLGVARTSGSGFEAYNNGYLTEINFIDGQALTPSSFGETDSATGVWKPKAYTGTYGTNGFYLDFADNTSTTTLGYDAAGSNDWTLNNFSVTAGAGNDSLVDSPTSYGTDTGVGGTVRGNYCTLNALWKNSAWSPTNGNLTANMGSGTDGYVALGSFAMPAGEGKWYFEIVFTSGSPSGANQQVGIVPISGSYAATQVTNTDISNGYSTTNGYAYNAGGTKNSPAGRNATYTGAASWGVNDVVGVAFDASAGTLTFYKNGISQGQAFSGITTSEGFYPAIADYAGLTVNINCGQRPFAYAAPSGFKALCTQNLPTPTIGATASSQASDYFNTVLYTGTGATQNITGLDFQPDWVWIKIRNQAYSHNTYDAVRGANKRLRQNQTGAEATVTDQLMSFNSNGFTLGADSGEEVNSNGNTFVAWNWKANGAGSSDTAGSITSTVSASTTSGFSIVTYTGNGSANQTVGHGLGVAPVFGILKDRDTNSNNDQWQVFHTAAGDKYAYLSTTAAFAGTAEFYPTSGSSTTVTVARTGGVIATTNESGDRFVMYLFAPVAGYSAFGSYTGNGSADGSFVFTNFRPRFVMVKRTDSTGYWHIWDTARNTYNLSNLVLFPNASDAETTYTAPDPVIDMLSNGFKHRGNYSHVNASGGTYIYAAFAENPFKYSLAR
jgi:hypothetical protein